MPIFGLIGAAIGTIGKLFGSWLDRKKVKAEGKIAIEKAKIDGQIKRVQAITEGDLTYDQIAAKGMQGSFKDEWFSLLLSAPFIASFIPQLQPYVKKGFEILQSSTPLWYQWAFLGAIVASFGLKQWFKNLIDGNKQ